MTHTTDADLVSEIERIAAAAGARAVALAFHDYETGRHFGVRDHEWFHAASTIKVPVLVAAFAAAERGEFTLDSRLHVRNCFYSVADATAYRVDPSRDADAQVYAQIGKTMRVRELARLMIVSSSNLATNLLVKLLGVERIRALMTELGAEGIDLQRGVEDEAAFQRGINNQVTAAGLVGVLGTIEEGVLSSASSEEMLRILHDQEFRSGIPAGLPDNARVANKTGEISTVAHDAGLVYLPNRQPYALAILTEWDAANTTGRRDTLASLSRAVYEYLVSSGSA